MVFRVHVWQNLKKVIAPVHYGISSSMITSFTQLQEAKELPELYMKSKEEMTMWKMLRRISDDIQIDLDSVELDQVTAVKEFKLNNITVKLDQNQKLVYFIKDDQVKSISFGKLLGQPSSVFRDLIDFL